MDMVGHGAESQNLYAVTGRNGANGCKPNQIVALAVENKAVVGRPLVAVVKDATFKWTVLHKHTIICATFVAVLRSSLTA